MRELLEKRQKLFFSGMRGAFSTPARAAEISSSMEQQMEALTAEVQLLRR